MIKSLILLLAVSSLITSCASLEAVGTSKDIEFNGANRIFASSTDSLFFDNFINNLKINGYTFEEIDRVNGVISVKPKTHSKYTGMTMYMDVSYLKVGGESIFIVSGNFNNQVYNAPSQSGVVMFTTYKSTSKIVWEELKKQFDSIPNVTFTYKRL